jgi:hypothetical protein
MQRITQKKQKSFSIDIRIHMVVINLTGQLQVICTIRFMAASFAITGSKTDLTSMICEHRFLIKLQIIMVLKKASITSDFLMCKGTL